jgi:hypothetical protein
VIIIEGIFFIQEDFYIFSLIQRMAETELKLEEAELQGKNTQVEFPSLSSVLHLLLSCVCFLFLFSFLKKKIWWQDATLLFIFHIL